jgi:ribosomal protein L11 methyltransferase
MILWQKRASVEWLAANEALLEKTAARSLAVISRPGRANSIVQVVCDPARSARLRRDFGGVAQPLPRKWSTSHPARKSRAPIRIGRRLEVISEPGRPSGLADGPQLIIPAAGAFGTGEHATTAMSLRLLEEITRNLPPGWRLLDAGTGSGILALAARQLGATEVLGLDNDPRAIAHARQNARLNHISRARFIAADLLQWKPIARYEVVTANLFSELLIAASPTFHRALRAKGCLIASGVLREQAESVARALRQARFHLEKQRRRGKWIAFLAARGKPS